MRVRSGYVLGASTLAPVALLGLTHLDVSGSADGAVIDPDDPAQVALGEKIYAAQCASCHGEDLQGQPDWQSRRADGTYPAPPHDETGHTWHHADALLRSGR